MQYLVAIYRPDNYDPSVETEEMRQEIMELNREMIAAGVRNFAGGLQAEQTAKSLRKTADGQVSETDGPYLNCREHMGGFWILEVAGMDEALTWGRKAVLACRASVEVRPFYPPLR